MLKIFCVYFDERPIWRSDCVEPIQAGKARTGTDLGILADDVGDSISGENARYGEMTAWYWVWRNYLGDHPELTHIGFSHYRRFLDFFGGGDRTVRTSYRRFRKVFARRYNSHDILTAIGCADVAMRCVTDSGSPTVRAQLVGWHPELSDDFDRFETLVRERHPDEQAAIDSVLKSGRLAMELQFVMTRALFVDWMEWAFSLCRAYERRWGWGGATDGERARTPAFLIERFFLVWLAIRRSQRNLVVREFPLVKLTARPWWWHFAKPFLRLLPAERQDALYTRYK